MNLSLAAGRHTVSATVIDRDGQRQTDEQAAVAVVGGGRGDGGSPSGVSSEGAGGNAAEVALVYNRNGNGNLYINEEAVRQKSGTASSFI